MDPSSDAPPFALDRYELVLLKRPTKPSNVSDEEIDRLQELHLAHLQALTRTGDIRVCGPFDAQSDESLRGMALYQTGSIERARELATSDPAVVAGRLEVDIMYFYCPQGDL